MIVNSTVYSGADQRKHQNSASLAFVRGIHRPVNSLHKGPVTRKMFQSDDVFMYINERPRSQAKPVRYTASRILYRSVPHQLLYGCKFIGHLSSKKRIQTINTGCKMSSTQLNSTQKCLFVICRNIHTITLGVWNPWRVYLTPLIYNT